MDIAPTLAAMLGIEPPQGVQGRVLFEGLDSPRGRRAE
jgi:arylsulfatase A-like enzyme